MYLKQFKQKGLKSGDRVEVEYIGMFGLSVFKIEGHYVKYSKGNVYVEDSKGSQLSLELDHIKHIVKLKVTKKKEKKEGVIVKDNIAYMGKQPLGIAYEINEEKEKKPVMQVRRFVKDEKGFREEKLVKSLSTLEIGGEVYSNICKLRVGDKIEKIYERTIIAKFDYQDELYFVAKADEECEDDDIDVISAMDLMTGSYVLKYMNRSSIIDEMIQLIESIGNPDVTYLPTRQRVNQFITYLKELKNEHK